MNYIAENLNKFRALPQKIRDAVGSPEALKTIETLESKYKVELGLLVVLVTVGELMMEDIEAYLIKKYKLSKKAATDINLTLQEGVFGPTIDALDDDPVLTVFALPLEDKKIVLKTLFEKSLVKLLKSDDEVIQIINNLIYLIIQQELSDENKVFEKELADIVYNSKEKVTDQPLTLGGKKYSGTVTNWIRDFINNKGTGYFSEMELSEYLIGSKNVRKLTEGEKNTVRNVLVLYRNLTYLTESMEEFGNQFQIIPVGYDHATEDSDARSSQVSARRLIVDDIKSRLGASDVEFSQYVNSLTDAGDDLDATQTTRLIAFAGELRKSIGKLTPEKRQEIDQLEGVVEEILVKGAGLAMAYEEDDKFRNRVRDLFVKIDV